MSHLPSQLRASHLKIPSPPLSKGPPGSTPSGPRLRALLASTLCTPSPSRPPHSLRSSQALESPGLRAIPFGGAAAGTGPARPDLPLQGPADANLLVTGLEREGLGEGHPGSCSSSPAHLPGSRKQGTPKMNYISQGAPLRPLVAPGLCSPLRPLLGAASTPLWPIHLGSETRHSFERRFLTWRA